MRDRSNGVIRVAVPITEDDAVVVVVLVLREMVDERRTGRTFFVQPFELVGNRVRVAKHVLGVAPEDERVALALDRKATHPDAVDVLDAGCQLVAPRDVVAGARGQDFDLGVAGEMLRQVPRMKFSAAVDRPSVSLYDDGELHW